jgi:glucose/arabinose dehydrogenase
VFDPEGRSRRIFATGIRNCSGLAINPVTGDPWCAANERDGLGDNLPPDYVTRVREGGFYGWPWYYMGAHEDPRHAGARPDLKSKVTIPDVLIQPHSAPLQIMFYDGDRFGADFKGNAFVALHGSWNRATRTGYKIIRAIVKTVCRPARTKISSPASRSTIPRSGAVRSGWRRPRTARFCSRKTATARSGG